MCHAVSHKDTTVKSPVRHVDPIVRALNTVMYGLVVHFMTIWMAVPSTFDDDVVGVEHVYSEGAWWAAALLAHEYWIYLQHSNVLANPFCQRLDRQYGIALLRSNQHWAIAGTLSAYWCRETFSMFLSLPLLNRSTQYLVLYSLVYHTIKSRGVRKDALRRYSPTFGIMRVVIDKFYLHTTPEKIVSLVRLALQGVDTYIHAKIVSDILSSSLIGVRAVPMLHALFSIWVAHAAMNQLLRCSTATVMVQTWNSLTAKRGKEPAVDCSMAKNMCTASDDDTVAESEDMSSVSETESSDEMEGYEVRHLLRRGRVPDELKGKRGAASGGVDTAVRVETILAIIATVYIVGLGDVPLRVLLPGQGNTAVCSSSDQQWMSLPYAWLLWSILYAVSVVVLPNKQGRVRKTNNKTGRRRYILYAADVVMVLVGVAVARAGSYTRLWAILLGAGVTAKSFLRAAGWRGTRVAWTGMAGIEILVKLLLARWIADGCEGCVASVGAVVCAVWGFSTVVTAKSDDSQAVLSKAKVEKAPDAVFFGHPAKLSDCWALWNIPYSLEERWEPPWWAASLWPLYYAVGYYTCKWRQKLWGDSFSFFNCDDVDYDGVQIQTWTAAHFGRHFVTSPRDVRRNIEAAARYAQDAGVKVFCLGALNKAESINGGGVGVVRALGPDRRMAIVHGNHLTAAAVVETCASCFGDKARVFLTGASSKVGWAVARALRDRFGYEILCHSTDQSRRDLFVKNGFKASSTLLEGTAFSPLWIVGKYDTAVADAIPQGGTAVVFSVPHPLDSRKDIQVVEAGTLHMDLSRLSRPRRFCNKLKCHEIFACHAAGIVAAHRLEHRQGSNVVDETGPVDPDVMDRWLDDAKALGFSVPAVSPVGSDRSVHNGVSSFISSSTAPVVVIGAGPAGLSVAASLQRRGVLCTVLEGQTKPDAFGSWDHHFSGLEVTTQKRRCNLPGFAMSDAEFPGENVGAEDYRRYLRMYADRFGIVVKRGSRVERVVRGDVVPWMVECASELNPAELIPASAVVVATGKHRIPQRASDGLCTRLKEGAIKTVHSTDLKDEETWSQATNAAREGKLCIVGFGNSAADICTAILQNVSTRGGIQRSGKTAIHVAARTVPPVFPRRRGFFRVDTIGLAVRLLPSAMQEAAIRLLWWGLPDSAACDAAFPLHLPRWSKVNGRVPAIDKYGQVASALRSGAIVGHGPVRKVSAKEVVFEDGAGSGGTTIPIEMVIMATGYKDESIVSREDRLNGLYRVGFGNDRLLPLKTIGEEAEAIAREITHK